MEDVCGFKDCGISWNNQAISQGRRQQHTDQDTFSAASQSIHIEAVSADGLWSTTCVLFSFDVSCCIYIKNAL